MSECNLTDSQTFIDMVNANTDDPIEAGHVMANAKAVEATVQKYAQVIKLGVLIQPRLLDSLDTILYKLIGEVTDKLAEVDKD